MCLQHPCQFCVAARMSHSFRKRCCSSSPRPLQSRVRRQNGCTSVVGSASVWQPKLTLIAGGVAASLTTAFSLCLIHVIPSANQVLIVLLHLAQLANICVLAHNSTALGCMIPKWRFDVLVCVTSHLSLRCFCKALLTTDWVMLRVAVTGSG
jgi:hypothetical protein